MGYPEWTGQIDLVWAQDWNDGSSMPEDEDIPAIDNESEEDEDMYDDYVDIDELDDPSEYIIEDDGSTRLDIKNDEIYEEE